MTPLVSGPIFQICWVVEEIEAAEQEFTRQWGVERWLRMPDIAFGPETTTYRGEPADYVVHVSIGYAGQPTARVDPTSVRTQPVHGVPGDSRRRSSSHGLGSDDYEATLLEAERRGMSVVQQGRVEGAGMEFSYLDAGPLGGYVELMKLSPEIRLMFASLIPD